MYVFWAILGIIFLIWDLAQKSLLKLVFASSFLFCSIFAFKFPYDFKMQIVCFPLFSLVFYFLIKKISLKEKNDAKKKSILDDFEGKTAFVVKDIGKTLSIDGIGTILYNNERWSAKSVNDKEIKAGSTVKIISREDLIMNVEVLNNAKS